jgi:sugar phosphate isomerase/epimerase
MDAPGQTTPHAPSPAAQLFWAGLALASITVLFRLYLWQDAPVLASAVGLVAKAAAGIGLLTLAAFAYLLGPGAEPTVRAAVPVGQRVVLVAACLGAALFPAEPPGRAEQRRAEAAANEAARAAAVSGVDITAVREAIVAALAETGAIGAHPGNPVARRDAALADPLLVLLADPEHGTFARDLLGELTGEDLAAFDPAQPGDREAIAGRIRDWKASAAQENDASSAVGP